MGRSESPCRLHSQQGKSVALPPSAYSNAMPTILKQICRLYLYGYDTSAALNFFQRHLDRFTILSQNWGIGDKTFEFWAWRTNQ
jgi:hypothetical protein